MLNAIKRGLIVLIGFLAQILLTLFIYLYLGEHITIISMIYGLLGFLLVLGLIKNSENYSYTLPWIIILLMFPIIGTLLYIILGRNKKKSKILKKIIKSENENKKYLVQDKKIREEYKNNSKLRYISDFAGFPVTKNNEISYYNVGDMAFPVILEELKKAKKYIFLEYFIIAKGKMWNSILDILKEKAKEGIDVRIIYDDFGCISTLKSSYPKELEKYGIKCIAFNNLNPIAGIIMNNRDHRKILIIDGKVAFSGGINIADEYINVIHKFGKWKDNCFRLIGDGVWNYTVMFLTTWNAFRNDDKDFYKYKYDFKNNINNGYVAPYAESPLDEEITGEHIYLNIINQANNYVYIFTPYLIIDTDVINSLTLAAKRGVDVRIVIPGIPDKKIVYTLSESYVEPLVKGGVKVYKYTPGFIHSKVFLSDDKIATVGTINMDYRSLYLHFECGCYFEDSDVIEDIKKDFTDTINVSQEITGNKANPGFIKGIWQALLRIFAPLM